MTHDCCGTVYDWHCIEYRIHCWLSNFKSISKTSMFKRKNIKRI